MAFLARALEQTAQPTVLIQEGARYHKSAAMQGFLALHTARVTVFQLPSYSPDYNPIEKLWKEVKKRVRIYNALQPLKRARTQSSKHC